MAYVEGDQRDQKFSENQPIRPLAQALGELEGYIAEQTSALQVLETQLRAFLHPEVRQENHPPTTQAKDSSPLLTGICLMRDRTLANNRKLSSILVRIEGL